MIPLLARTPLRHAPPTPWPSGGGNRALSPKGPRRLFPLVGALSSEPGWSQIRARNRARQQAKRIGFWYSASEPHLPDPRKQVDPTLSQADRERVAAYLDAGDDGGMAARGCAPCRICGKSNGNKERTDGTYLWPSGLSHYVRDHSVRLDPAFLRHVQAKTSTQVGEVATVIPPEMWRDDGRTPAPHWSQAQLFAACDPSFGKPLADFLAYMKTAYGADIRIIDSWRPWFTQADKLRRGVSKVDTSYHNHVTPDLRPAALGADLLLVYPEGKTTLSRKDYQEGVGKAMRASALQFGLAMGWFGLGNPARTVENAYALPMGWDPFHIQLFTPPYSITALRKLLTERYTARGVPPAVSPASPLAAPLAAPLTTPSPSQEAPEEEAPEEVPASGGGGLLLVGLGALVLGAWGLSRRAA